MWWRSHHNIVMDVAEDGVSVGIEIDANASKIVDLSRLEIEGLRMSLGLESPPRSQTD
jgi:hypothetical protein